MKVSVVANAMGKSGSYMQPKSRGASCEKHAIVMGDMTVVAIQCNCMHRPARHADRRS